MRGGTPTEQNVLEDADAVSPEKQEEMKLMNKLAAKGALPAKGPSNFLQKRLQQRKFFDSGDYAMDKAKKGQTKGPGARAREVTTVTTTEDIANTNNTATPTIMEHEAPMNTIGVETTMLNTDNDMDTANTATTGLEIPRPETVPQRKSSIIYPSMHSKLSPQPHLHHPMEPLEQQENQ